MKPREGIHLKNVTVNTSAQLIVRIISSGTTLLTTLLISYILGFYEYGSFAKVTTFVSFFYLLLDFGINPIFLQHYFEHTHQALDKLLYTRLFMACFFFSIVCLLALLVPYNSTLNTGFSISEKIGIFMYSLTLFPYALTLSLTTIIQKKLSYKLLISPTLISSFFQIALVMCGVLLKNSLIIYISFVLSLSLLFYFLKRDLSYTFSSLSKKHIILFSKHILRASFPLALILFLNLVYAKVDMILLAFYKSNFDVGVYGFSYKIFDFAIALPTFFANSIYPILLLHKDKATFTKLVKQYAYILFGASFIVLFILIIAAPFLSILKKDFAYSVYPLQLLSLSLPFFFLTSLFQWILIIKNKKRFLVGVYFFSMILNVYLNVMYIPRYGYAASAVITVICEGLVFIAMIFYLLFLKTRIFSTKNYD